MSTRARRAERLIAAEIQSQELRSLLTATITESRLTTARQMLRDLENYRESSENERVALRNERDSARVEARDFVEYNSELVAILGCDKGEQLHIAAGRVMAGRADAMARLAAREGESLLDAATRVASERDTWKARCHESERANASNGRLAAAFQEERNQLLEERARVREVLGAGDDEDTDDAARRATAAAQDIGETATDPKSNLAEAERRYLESRGWHLSEHSQMHEMWSPNDPCDLRTVLRREAVHQLMLIDELGERRTVALGQVRARQDEERARKAVRIENAQAALDSSIARRDGYSDALSDVAQRFGVTANPSSLDELCDEIRKAMESK